MTISLRPEAEAALSEALALLTSGDKTEIRNGMMVTRSASGLTRTRLANVCIEAVCTAIIRDGFVKWPVVIEQRHETEEEMQARMLVSECAS